MSNPAQTRDSRAVILILLMRRAAPMKYLVRFMFVLGLLAIVQTGDALADATIPGLGVDVVKSSNSIAPSPFVTEPINLWHSWMIQRTMDVSLTDSESSLNDQEATPVVEIPASDEGSPSIELSRPDRTSGERTAAGPIDPQIAAVPEPMTLVLLGSGLLLPLVWKRRNR
jgi:hypothetical protein